MIEEFFATMIRLENEGIEAVFAMDLTRARRVVRQLKMYPDEQYTLQLRIKLAKLLQQGELEEARDLAQQVLCNKWGDSYALYALRLNNPATSPKCKVFGIELHAGVACATPLGQFPSEHTVTFGVVAESQEAAIKYIELACGIHKTEQVMVNKHFISEESLEGADNQGVYSCSTFSKIKAVI